VGPGPGFGDVDLAFALAAEGKVLWLLGLGMAACNLTGARLWAATPDSPCNLTGPFGVVITWLGKDWTG
jgi:hypothetical protein